MPSENAERIVYRTESQPAEALTLYSVDSRAIGVFEVAALERMPSVRLTRNRKGKAVRAQMRPLTCHIRQVLSAEGSAFEQHLENGKVWALRGVTGSAK